VEAAIDADDDLAVQLLALRLAVILSHARRDPVLDGISLQRPEPAGRLFQLNCPTGWVTAYPQSAHLLREEALAWQKTQWVLEISGG